MVQLNVNTPPPVENTYDLIGLTHDEAARLFEILRHVKGPFLNDVYDALDAAGGVSMYKYDIKDCEDGGFTWIEFIQDELF